MKKNYIKTLTAFLFVVSLFLATGHVIAQDTLKKEKVFKNTVRFNITNPMLFGGKAILVGYERTVGKYQSVTIDIGSMSLPRLLPSDIVSSNNTYQVTRGSTEKGFHISGEYRFYLPHENKHQAPRGVYLAPYFSYNFFERKNNWNLNTSAFQGDVTTTFNLTMSAIGGELGYQFILWKRMAVDLVLIGPGLTNYSIETKLSTTLSAEDEAELFQKINDALASKIPGYSLVIDDAEFEKSGSANTTTFGFRYMIHLGFRF